MMLDKLICATKEERINTKRRYNNTAIYNYLEIPERCFNKKHSRVVTSNKVEHILNYSNSLISGNAKQSPIYNKNMFDPIVKDLLQVNKDIKQLKKKPLFIQNYIDKCELY